MRRRGLPTLKFDGAKYLSPGEEWKANEVRSVLNGVLNADLDHSGRMVREHKSGKGLKRISKWVRWGRTEDIPLPPGDEEGARFVLGLVQKTPAVRERLVREAAAALRVLRKLARQIAQAALPPHLSRDEIAVLNELLRRPPILQAEEGAPVYANEEGWPVSFRAQNQPRAPFTAPVYRAARYLATLAECRVKVRLRLCEAPKDPENLDSGETCGRFFVESTQGQPSRYCSLTCKQNAYLRREEEKLSSPSAHPAD